MKLRSSVLNWLRRLIIRYGVFRTVLLFTAVSIVLSVLVTTLFATWLANGPDVMSLSIAVAVPGIIAPILNYILLSLLQELERAREVARTLAITDDLTHAFNRRYFIELAKRELARARRLALPLSVILFDVDDFKNINDTYGHLCGDQVLQQLSGTCQAIIRRYDIFARYGGEEFTLLMPETNREDACVIAERIRQKVAMTSTPCAGSQVQITLSLGVTTLDGDIVELDDFLTRADRALYAAKQAGKDCVRFA